MNKNNTIVLQKVKDRRELEERTNHLISVITESGNKRAFRELECLITGSCICDLCPEWGHFCCL